METNTNMEVARIVDGGAVMARDPFNADQWYHAANVAAFVGSARARLMERCEQFLALGDVSAAPLDAVKELRKAIEADDKALKDFDSKFKDALLALSGFEAFVVQTRGKGKTIDPMSVRGKFAEMVAALKAREDAAKPPMPTHTYFYAVTATDAAHAALQRSMRKVDEHFGCVAPQSVKEWRQLDKIFAGPSGSAE